MGRHDAEDVEACSGGPSQPGSLDSLAELCGFVYRESPSDPHELLGLDQFRRRSWKPDPSIGTADRLELRFAARAGREDREGAQNGGGMSPMRLIF